MSSREHCHLVIRSENFNWISIKWPLSLLFFLAESSNRKSGVEAKYFILCPVIVVQEYFVKDKGRNFALHRISLPSFRHLISSSQKTTVQYVVTPVITNPNCVLLSTAGLSQAIKTHCACYKVLLTLFITPIKMEPKITKTIENVGVVFWYTIAEITIL